MRIGFTKFPTIISEPSQARITSEVTPAAVPPCTSIANDVSDAWTGPGKGDIVFEGSDKSVPGGSWKDAGRVPYSGATATIGRPSMPEGSVATLSLNVTAPSPTNWSSSPGSIALRASSDRVAVMSTSFSAWMLNSPVCVAFLAFAAELVFAVAGESLTPPAVALLTFCRSSAAALLFADARVALRKVPMPSTKTPAAPTASPAPSDLSKRLS
jgi:hypothetical protein